MNARGGGAQRCFAADRAGRSGFRPLRAGVLPPRPTADGRIGKGRSGARAVLALCLAVAGILLPTPAVAQGLPNVMAGIPVGGLIPAPTASQAHPPVTVQQLVVAAVVRAEEPRLSLLPSRVTAVLDARYSLRLLEGERRPHRVSLRLLATPDVEVRWDGRPTDVYPMPYRLPEDVPAPGQVAGEDGLGRRGEAPAGAGGAAEPAAGTDGMMRWLDPLTGRFYPVPQATALGAPQALAIDVVLRPGREHHLQLHFPRVPLGWDGSRYLSPVHQLIVPLYPEAWAGFGQVHVHLAVPRGYVAGLAGDVAAGHPASGAEGAGGPDAAAVGPNVERRWEQAPSRMHIAAVDTAGMWGRLVTRRRDVLWLLASTWLVFAALRAGLWRVGRRRDAWAWAALPPLLALPLLAGWVSWRSLRVPLWGYPFSLAQYALWVALGLYVAGRILGDLVGFLALRLRYRRAARAPGGPGAATAPGARGDGSQGAPGVVGSDGGGLTTPAGGP